VHPIDIGSSDIPDQTLEQQQLLPDGHDGLLVVDRKRPSVIRIDAKYRVAARNTQLVPNDATRYYETEYVLGEDAAYALMSSYVFFSGSGNTYRSRVMSFDPQTLQTLNIPTDLGTPMTAPQHIRMKFALSGGGIYAAGPAAAYVVNAAIDTSGFAMGGNATHVANGLWSGWNGTGTPSAATGAEVSIPQTRWAYAGGVESANAPSPRLLTTTRLRELAAERGIGVGAVGVQKNQAIGLAFQGTVIWSLYQREDSNGFFLHSPARETATLGAVSNVVPDYLGPYIDTGSHPGAPIFVDSSLTEVKAVAGVMRLPYSRYQIIGLVDAAKISALGVTNTTWPLLEFITTADTSLGLDVIERATFDHVEIRQRLVLEHAGGFLQVGSGRSLNGSWWNMFISGRNALPALLPGHALATLGSHMGESPAGDPDPPTIEP
jgi:hypothetical protein